MLTLGLVVQERHRVLILRMSFTGHSETEPSIRATIRSFDCSFERATSQTTKTNCALSLPSSPNSLYPASLTDSSWKKPCIQHRIQHSSLSSCHRTTVRRSSPPRRKTSLPRPDLALVPPTTPLLGLSPSHRVNLPLHYSNPSSSPYGSTSVSSSIRLCNCLLFLSPFTLLPTLTTATLSHTPNWLLLESFSRCRNSSGPLSW